MDLHIDVETYCDLDLRKVGLAQYVRHPSFRLLMVSWAVDDGPVQFYSGVEADDFAADIPPELDELLRNPLVEVWAHNAAFERAVLTRLGYGSSVVPLSRWRDTMLLANYLALPPKLDTLLRVITPDERFHKTAGMHLINRFCSPRRGEPLAWNAPTVEQRPFHGDETRWEEFKRYNQQDVEAERHAHKLLAPWGPPPWVWEMWLLDQKINDRGLPVNMRMVRSAQRIAEAEKARLAVRLAAVSGVDNPNRLRPLLRRVRELGYPFDDLTKAHVARALKTAVERDDADGKLLAEILRLRQEISAASTAKYDALQRASTPSLPGYHFYRLKGAFQFLGASRTGRWAGRVFQPQNLPRPAKAHEGREVELAKTIEAGDVEALREKFGAPLDALRSAVRSAVQAPPGKMLVAADLSAIESRGIGWICGDEAILAVFREGRDTYLSFAQYLFDMSYEELLAEFEAGDKTKRTLAKPAVLGCGYRLGPGRIEVLESGEEEATGLLGYARAMGIELSPEMAQRSVELFREKYSRVRDFWFEIEDRVKWAVRNPGQPVKHRMFGIVASPNFLRIRLPSSRCLHYYKPAIVPHETPWGDVRPTICYRGMHNGAFKRLFTHGGKLLENLTQAVAADVLMHGLRRADEEGLPVIMHVHDEIVLEARKEEAEEMKERLISIMSEQPAWAPDMPLAASGWISPVFIKD